jgi:histone H3/H4
MATNGKGGKYPQDEMTMRSILKDMGITEYEPRVVQQMLEFAYRYTTEVLEEAKVYSNHAKKKVFFST